MASFYRTLARFWYVLPKPTRRFISRTPGLRGIKQGLTRLTQRRTTHDEVYSEQYYAERADQARRSAAVMATTIVEELHPGSVIDVGCGTGDLLVALRERGVRVRGCENSAAALKVCRDRGLAVEQVDLRTAGVRDQGDVEVVISTEVAEHLPKSAADRFVEFLTAGPRTVVFTAAAPGQGGRNHLNEQPHAYWVGKFRKRGYRLDESMTVRWRRAWRGNRIAPWYCSNLMIFRAQPAGT